MLLEEFISSFAGRKRSRDEAEGQSSPSGLMDRIQTAKNSLLKFDGNSKFAESFSSKKRNLNSGIEEWMSQGHREVALPPDEELRSLVDVFFSRFHVWIPMIHEKTFRNKMDSTDRQAIRNVLYAITSVTVRFSNQRAFEDKPMCETYSRLCAEHVLLKSMEQYTVENVQALIIIAFNLIGSGGGPKAWSIVDSMTRIVEHTQLSYEEESDEPGVARLIERIIFLPKPQSFSEEEERRRVFWFVFILDRFCSVSSGWNPGITSADAKRRLPCDGKFFNAGNEQVYTSYFSLGNNGSGYDSMKRTKEEESNMGSVSYLIESTELLSRVVRFYVEQKLSFHSSDQLQVWIRKFWNLDQILSNWKHSLPHKFRIVQSARHTGRERLYMDPNLMLAHVTHNTSVVLLHQYLAYPAQPELISIFRHYRMSSANTCLSAASEVSKVCKTYLSVTDGFVSPQLAFCLFASGQVILAHAANFKEPISKPFYEIQESLETISKRWDNFTNTTNLASTLLSCLITSQSRLHETVPIHKALNDANQHLEHQPANYPADAYLELFGFTNRLPVDDLSSTTATGTGTDAIDQEMGSTYDSLLTGEFQDLVDNSLDRVCH